MKNRKFIPHVAVCLHADACPHKRYVTNEDQALRLGKKLATLMNTAEYKTCVFIVFDQYESIQTARFAAEMVTKHSEVDVMTIKKRELEFKVNDQLLSSTSPSEDTFVCFITNNSSLSTYLETDEPLSNSPLDRYVPVTNYKTSHKINIQTGDSKYVSHGKSDNFIFHSNKTIQEIKLAYEESCKLTQICFDDWSKHSDFVQILDKNAVLSIEIIAQLQGHGINLTDLYDSDNYTIKDIDSAMKLFIAFIKLSLPDLTIEESEFKRSQMMVFPRLTTEMKGMYL